MRFAPMSGGRMKWLMLAQAFEGIVQFMEEFGWMLLRFTILDDDAGPVGMGVLGYYRPVGSNGSSVIGVS